MGGKARAETASFPPSSAVCLNDLKHCFGLADKQIRTPENTTTRILSDGPPPSYLPRHPRAPSRRYQHQHQCRQLNRLGRPLRALESPWGVGGTRAARSRQYISTSDTPWYRSPTSTRTSSLRYATTPPGQPLLFRPTPPQAIPPSFRQPCHPGFPCLSLNGGDALWVSSLERDCPVLWHLCRLGVRYKVVDMLLVINGFIYVGGL